MRLPPIFCRSLCFLILLVFPLSSLSIRSSAVLADAGPGASDCGSFDPYLGNSTTIACVNGTNGEKYIAGDTVFADNTLDVIPSNYNSGRRINNSIWLFTSTDLMHFLEAGNTYGYCNVGIHPNICPGQPQTPQAYRYWADTSNGGHDQIAHFIQFWTVGNNYQHDWGLYRETAPNNICNWDVYLDGIKWGASTVQDCPGGLSYGYEHQVGEEYEDDGSAPHSSYPYSNTVSDEQNQVYYNGAWHYWTYQYNANTEPCGGSQTTNCFNGTNNGGNSYWTVNRPRG